MKDLHRTLARLGIVQPVPYKEAREAWRTWRVANGFGPDAPLFTQPDGNVKLRKTKAPTYGLSLAPDKLSGGVGVCRYSTPECRRGCVAFAGKGSLPRIIEARVSKTMFLATHPREFVTLLDHELTRAKEKHAGQTVHARLNTFSDLAWEQYVPWLFVKHADVRFYDYTKWPVGSRTLPRNYSLTYSVSEKTSDDVITGASRSTNFAVVFDTVRGHALPLAHLGRRVIDGDTSDDRHADPRGVIVGLRAKGGMRKGTWNMVRKGATS